MCLYKYLLDLSMIIPLFWMKIYLIFIYLIYGDFLVWPNLVWIVRSVVWDGSHRIHPSLNGHSLFCLNNMK